MTEQPKVFYQCQRSGNCCRWPGVIRITDDEADKIADYLKIPLAEFLENYTEILPDRKGLGITSRENHECSFLSGHNTCLIHEVKPAQCKGFPNVWNFPGWRNSCRAIPIPVEPLCENDQPKQP